MNIEVVFFRGTIGGRDVVITDKRISIGNRTIPTNKITSINLDTIQVFSLAMIAGFFVVGVTLATAAYHGNIFGLVIDSALRTEFAIMSAVFLIPVPIMWRYRFRHSVMIGSASGIQSAFSSRNMEDIHRVIDLVNQAIADR